MGAGKSTLGAQAAERTGFAFLDLDDSIELAVGRRSPQFFREHGEPAFRELEEAETLWSLVESPPSVIALGGGAVTSTAVREGLRMRAITVWVDVDVDTCWERAHGSGRPLAQDEAEFRRLYEERRPLYAAVADAVARDADDVVLAAAGVHVERGALRRLGELVPGDGPVALVSDPHVAGIHGMDAQLALGARLAQTHELPPGEEAKTLAALDRLWQELRLDRRGTIVALGGGCTTDAAGFAAATYLRGIAWVPVPTSLVAQVDAAIGGKTAIDLPQGKNLVGAFHWPARTVVDPSLLETLPEAQRREGMAEVVKTGLLAGEPLWELPDARARPPLRRLQGGRLPARPARPRRARRAQPRPHVRARARDGGRLRAPDARPGGRARPARRAAPVRAGHRPGGGDPAPAARPRRPGARLGGDAARQEGGRRRAAARPARRRRPALGRRASRRRTCARALDALIAG